VTEVTITPFPVPNLVGVNCAFAAGIAWVPPMKDVPEQYKSHSYGSTSRAYNLFTNWFYKGLEGHNLALLPRDGVDGTAAWYALKVVLMNFGLKHEHKTAAFMYLLEQWFSDFRYQVSGGGLEVPFENPDLEKAYQTEEFNKAPKAAAPKKGTRKTKKPTSVSSN